MGTGLGPTLEFYSLVSKELQRADLQLWKGATVKIGTEDVMEEEEGGSRDCVEYVYSDTGLYPLPIARNCKSSQPQCLGLLDVPSKSIPNQPKIDSNSTERQIFWCH